MVLGSSLQWLGSMCYRTVPCPYRMRSYGYESTRCCTGCDFYSERVNGLQTDARSPHVFDVVGYRYSGAPRGIAGSAFSGGLGKRSNTTMM